MQVNAHSQCDIYEKTIIQTYKSSFSRKIRRMWALYYTLVLVDLLTSLQLNYLG